jgi:hypothetical protein
MPGMHHFAPLVYSASWAYNERDATMVDCHRRSPINLANGEEMPSSPQIVALAFDVPRGRLARLRAEPRLLLTNPRKPGCCVRTGHVDSRIHRRHQRNVSGRRMHCEMDVLHGLPGQLDRHIRELDRRGHHQ